MNNDEDIDPTSTDRKQKSSRGNPTTTQYSTTTAKQGEIENLQNDLEKYSRTLQQVIGKIKADAVDTSKTKRKKPDFIDGKNALCKSYFFKFCLF